MLDGVNDEEQHAHQLGKLLETFDVVSFNNAPSFVTFERPTQNLMLISTPLTGCKLDSF